MASCRIRVTMSGRQLESCAQPLSQAAELKIDLSGQCIYLFTIDVLVHVENPVA